MTLLIRTPRQKKWKRKSNCYSKSLVSIKTGQWSQSLIGKFIVPAFGKARNHSWLAISWFNLAQILLPQPLTVGPGVSDPLKGRSIPPVLVKKSQRSRPCLQLTTPPPTLSCLSKMTFRSPRIAQGPPKRFTQHSKDSQKALNFGACTSCLLYLAHVKLVGVQVHVVLANWFAQ